LGSNAITSKKGNTPKSKNKPLKKKIAKKKQATQQEKD